MKALKSIKYQDYNNFEAIFGVLLEWYKCNFFIKKLYLYYFKKYKYNILITSISFQKNSKNTQTFLILLDAVGREKRKHVNTHLAEGQG